MNILSIKMFNMIKCLEKIVKCKAYLFVFIYCYYEFVIKCSMLRYAVNFSVYVVVPGYTSLRHRVQVWRDATVWFGEPFRWWQDGNLYLSEFVHCSPLRLHLGLLISHDPSPANPTGFLPDHLWDANHSVHTGGWVSAATLHVSHCDALCSLPHWFDTAAVRKKWKSIENVKVLVLYACLCFTTL